MSIDGVGELDRDLDEGQADQQSEDRKQELEFGHWPPPACNRRLWQSAGPVRKRERVEADDPARNRCGCFLPDLTRLATAPSADFRAGIWAKALARKFFRGSSLAVHAPRTNDGPRHRRRASCLILSRHSAPRRRAAPRQQPIAVTGHAWAPSSARWASRSAPARRRRHVGSLVRPGRPQPRRPAHCRRDAGRCRALLRRRSTPTMMARSIPTSSPITNRRSHPKSR